MTNKEILYQLLTSLRPAMWEVITVLSCALVSLILLLVFCKSVWVSNKNFKIYGFFFGLDMKNALFLSCAFLDLLFVIVYLAFFKKLELIHYILYLVPSIVYVVRPVNLRRMPIRILWLILEVAGLFACNVICGYILDVFRSPQLILIYILASILVILLAAYRLLNAIQEISGLRKVENV